MTEREESQYGTQLEHQFVANMVWSILCEQFPFLHDIEG